MGACIIACGKQQQAQCQREQAYISSQDIAKIEEEVKAQPTTPNSQTIEPQQKVILEGKVGPTRQRIRNQVRKTTKSRFFQLKKQHESVVSLTENTDNIQQHSPRLELRLSNSKSIKRYRKHHFREEDWEDQGSTEKRSSSQQIFQSMIKDGIEVDYSSFIIVHEKKPLLLPQEVQHGLSGLQQPIKSNLSQILLDPQINTPQINYCDGSIYTGETMMGQRHGMGTLKWKDGSFYEGHWKDGNAHGMGTLIYADGDKYVGEFHCNRAQGKGQFISTDGLRYNGEWKESLPFGQGSEEFRNGQKFTGHWYRGTKNGYGQLYFEDGASFYKGEFLDNELHGDGEYYWHGKSRYVGHWQHNEKSGRGCMVWENGERYEGEFQHDKMHGQGVFYAKNGSKFTGGWEYGRREGVMVETTACGEVKQGLWYFNKLLNGITVKQSSEPERISLKNRISCPI